MSKRRCRSGTSRKTDQTRSTGTREETRSTGIRSTGTREETRSTGIRTRRSRTRSRTPDETRSLRALVQHALSAVAAEVLLLLEERVLLEEPVLQELKQRVTERITAAVEIIFSGFRSSRGPEGPPGTAPGQTLSVSGDQLSVSVEPGTSCRPEPGPEPDPHPGPRGGRRG
ncbi:hypothetical protein CgunFtcFv8_005891 [Champsocephalus gunnari]|uniref:Uncharacterized protein n=1 Tax=Champsocephalus gunnari TaxID=52237 RepID=A0AAN8CYA8_CHAGU|nr:hypothetical protein CgunFtcFv8_005891 [Champsocephalus gunnari]